MKVIHDEETGTESAVISLAGKKRVTMNTSVIQQKNQALLYSMCWSFSSLPPSTSSFFYHHKFQHITCSTFPVLTGCKNAIRIRQKHAGSPWWLYPPLSTGSAGHGDGYRPRTTHSVGQKFIWQSKIAFWKVEGSIEWNGICKVIEKLYRFLIFSVSSLCFNYGLQTIRERKDDGIYEFNIEFFYDFVDSFLELIKVSDFHFIYFSLDNSPKILDNIEIGWIRLPVIHPARRIGIEPFHSNFRCMFWIIVLLEDPVVLISTG